jgi:hypothetical protein
MYRWSKILLAGALFGFAGLSGPAGAQDDREGADGAAPADESAIEEEVLGGGDEASLDEEQAAVEFNKRLLTVEEDVNSLKERVFRSKATLQLLREIVIQGSSSGSRAVLWHVNTLGPTYTIESISYYLDGQSVYAKADPTGSLDAAEELKVWEGAIPPGNHNLTVNLVLRGNGFGVFKYVEGYTFRVQSSYAFVADDGHISNVRVIVDERKGIARSFVERPNVEYDVKSVRLFEEE